MSAQPPTLFFIGGARRSGTTWLTKMLNSHPDILALGEGFFVGAPGGGWGLFPSCIDEKKFAKWAAIENVQESWLAGTTVTESLLAAKRGVIEAIMLAARARSPKPHAKAVGDKSAYASNRFSRDLFAIFPDSIFIDIVRDGRDCIVSDAFLALRADPMQFPAEARPQLAAARSYFIDKQGEAVPLLGDGGWLCARNAREWRDAVRGGDEAATLWGDRYIRFQYESLLNEPASIARAFTVLGVDDSPATVARCVEQNRFEKLAGGRTPGQEDRASFYRKGTAGGWQEYLTDADKSVIKDTCNAELVQLGYASDRAW